MELFTKYSKPINANCPYCDIQLDKVPMRKTRCPSCGKYIYVRTRPSDHNRILATEEDTKRIEEEWKKIIEEQEYKRRMDFLNVSHEEYLYTENELSEKFKTTPSQRDIFWAILNHKLLEAIKNNSWGTMSGLYFQQALFLKDEGKNPFISLQESKRCELRNHQSFGVKRVKILSCDSSCDKCKILNGKIYTISEALEIMPIPVDNCANSYGYCRCLYSPLVN